MYGATATAEGMSGMGVPLGRMPQSSQSVPKAQTELTDPSPPSSHSPSLVYAPPLPQEKSSHRSIGESSGGAARASSTRAWPALSIWMLTTAVSAICATRIPKTLRRKPLRSAVSWEPV